MLDSLTDVLMTLRMRGTLYFRTNFRAPWGVEVPARQLVARFHLLIRGEAWIEVGGVQTRMRRGDLVIVPHGARHFLRDKPERPTILVGRVLDESSYDGTADLCHGGTGESTVLVCGHFSFDDELLHPVLAALPPVVHIEAAQGHDFTWLDAATRTVAAETSKRAPGWEAVVDHVSTILFIQSIRVALTRPELNDRITVFSDQQVGRALDAIHADPTHAWTLREMAQRAGMSRTVFAQRFRDCVGMTAMAYVTRWRLQRARRRLLDTNEIIAAVAGDAGYSSEAAFCRAFQRLYGSPPGAYRRERAEMRQP